MKWVNAYVFTHSAWCPAFENPPMKETTITQAHGCPGTYWSTRGHPSCWLKPAWMSREPSLSLYPCTPRLVQGHPQSVFKEWMIIPPSPACTGSCEGWHLPDRDTSSTPVRCDRRQTHSSRGPASVATRRTRTAHFVSPPGRTQLSTGSLMGPKGPGSPPHRTPTSEASHFEHGPGNRAVHKGEGTCSKTPSK